MALWNIKLARGKKANLPQLSLGEPAYVTDEGELYIGGTNGENINITNNAELKEKANKTNAEFTGYIKLNNNDVADIEIKNMTLLNGWTLFDGSLELIRVGKVGFINLSLKSGVTNPEGSTQVLELPFYSKNSILSLTGYGEMNNINVTIIGNQVHVWGIGSAVERLPINIPIPIV